MIALTLYSGQDLTDNPPLDGVVALQSRGSTFLETGGSSGLDAATVHFFSRQGANMIIAGLNGIASEGMAAEC